MKNRKRVAVLISGRGSNMAALVSASRTPDYPAEICLVIADRPDAVGLDLARGQGIDARAIDRKGFDSRAAFDAAIDECLRAADIDLVCLAGFMRIFSPGFVDKWPGRILNIHPALLPSFPGLDTYQRALDAGVKISGCTVHVVTAELDAGPIVAQGAVPVYPGDTADVLAKRILAVEHRLYPFALYRIASQAADPDPPAETPVLISPDEVMP